MLRLFKCVLTCGAVAIHLTKPHPSAKPAGKDDCLNLLIFPLRGSDGPS